MLTEIIKFKNRQIIINEYDDEELMSRNGFVFENIIIENAGLCLFKNKKLIFTYMIPANPIIRKDLSFQNFYVIEFGSNRTEIYFP